MLKQVQLLNALGKLLFLK